MNTSGPLVRASILILLVILFFKKWMESTFEGLNVHVFFVFSDSHFDMRNNYHIPETIKYKFSPHGRYFIAHVPNEHFSNGKLMSVYFSKDLLI